MEIKIPLVLIFLFFLLIPLTSATNYYNITYYDTVSSGNPQTTYGFSLRTNNTGCQIDINPRIDAISLDGSNYQLLTQYYSPHDIQIGYSNIDFSTNRTCFSVGNIPSSGYGEGQNYESKTIITRTSGSSHETHLATNYSCSTEQDWIYLSTSGYDLDTDGYQNLYYEFECNAASPSFNPIIDLNDFDPCGGIDNSKLLQGTYYSCCGVACVANNENRIYMVYPFKTGASGRITYDISFDHYWVAFEAIGYYDLETETYVNLTAPYSGALSLQPNTWYAFYSHGNPGVGNKKGMNANISVEVYEPDWVCSPWSDCDLGLQTRTCIDPLGKIPNKIESQGCFDTAIADVLLGFEEGVEPPAYIRKCELQWWPACIGGYIDISDTMEYPQNWNIINPSLNYFIKMTGEYATEGSRSLQMWYIPPMWAYQYPGSICNWSNSGKIPQIYKGLNDSFFVEFNVTFPSTYMTIDYDVKRCAYPVTQYDGWCGKQCYGYNGNCSEDAVRGEYVSILTNPTTGEIIYEFYDEADLSWGTKHIDLSYSNITTGETYNLAFAVYPRHLTDAYGHCIYLDNVRLSIREADLSCDANFCVEVDLYKPKILNQTCVYEIEYNSPECLSEENRILAEQYSDYCVDESLFSYNNDTNEWEETINATYCIELQEKNSITEPIPVLTEYVQSVFEPIFGSNWVLFAFFLTPLFISLAISLIVSFYIIDKAKINSGEGIIFVVTFLSLLGSFSLVGLFPAWFTLILIIISGGILAYQIFGKT